MTDRKYPPFHYLIGRVTRNPEETTAGTRDVVKLSVFRNFSFDKDDGSFVDVTAFGEGPKRKLLNVSKGDRIAMEGTLKEREYNGKTYYDFVPMSVYKAVEPEADDDL
jgi:single-stranded DNA-binding protein